MAKSYRIIPGDWISLERVIQEIGARVLNEDGSLTDYTLADGTRAFTGVVSGVTPTANAHLATKLYTDTLIGAVHTYVSEYGTLVVTV